MNIPTKTLKFIHITKTAGTSIETVGLENNLRWGLNHKEYGFWHEIFLRKPKELRDKYDWFVVVRNPYKRVLSEYNFLIGALNIKDTHTKKEFNNFIQKWITNASNNKQNHPTFGRVDGDHFTEQYKYIDNESNIHILKFENIEEEFNKLMKTYNYDIKLNKKLLVSKNKRFSIDDISKENITLINTVYQKDFEMFGYDMINYNAQNKNLSTQNNKPPTITEQPIVTIEHPIVTTEQLTETTEQLTETTEQSILNKEPMIIYNTTSPKKPLKFIHISRTGGTSIEQIGLDNDILWGRYHRGYGQFDEIFRLKLEHLKQSHDWFVVVRNPYTRIISDYHYLSLIFKLKDSKNTKVFNSFIKKWIENIENNIQNNPIHGKLNGGHFTPQYLYVPANKKHKIHILKYENLEEEFNSLMNDYDYDIKLNKKVNVSKKYITVSDISNENLRLIQRVYKKDFELFNYSIDSYEE